jgi:hypothetical protein
MKNKTLKIKITRYFLYTLLCILPSITFSQKAMNEQRAMKESHIDFTKEYIFFTIHGLIEIDGHIFKNDTCKSPIQFQATLDGIMIIDTISKTEYVHRVCNHKNCNIIHLEERISILKIEPSYDDFILR